jgi:hypothetical protein
MAWKFETLQINLLCDEGARDEDVGDERETLPKVALEALSYERTSDEIVKVLAFGSEAGKGIYDRIVEYDVKTRKWDRIFLMPQDLLGPKLYFGATATPLHDGRILVCSSYDDASHEEILFEVHITAIQPQSFILDPRPENAVGGRLAFEMLPVYDSRQFACRSHASLVTLHNGKVLRVGGLLKQIYQNDGIAEFDPATKQWTLVVPNNAPADAFSVVLPNGRVLITGGRFRSEKSIKECLIYDPESRTFEKAASMKHERRRHTGCLLANGDVCVFGGMTTPANVTCELWSASTGTWTVISNEVRNQHSHCFRMPDNRIFMAGGHVQGCTIFNPETRHFRPADEMPFRMLYPLIVGLTK